ncbi:MAG: flagellar basal-body rod protein FlgF [Lachnospiraceae bacterium]|nr:flagellar basal-body rod protein FlgF [Lachnospiraceae bacterium]
MVRALYTAWTGLRNEEKRMDVVTNNMANANTTGYKKIEVTSQSFDRQLAVKINDVTVGTDTVQGIGGVTLGVKIGETYFDMSQGSFRQTENLYNFALSGKGFFTIRTTNKAGETTTRYTRDGDFTVTKDGYLVTKDGDFVLGESGNPIQIPGANTAEIAVNSMGEIYVGGNYIDTFRLVDFENYDALSSYGENMYEPVDGAVMIEAEATVQQGYLEMSNVNMVTEMVDMIAVTRAYETNQKMIQTVDQTLDKAVNEIGRV